MAKMMYPFVDICWNPIAMICPHACTYCWGPKLKKTRLKNVPRYKNLLRDKPFQLVEKELRRQFKGTVFVEDMGDLFAASIPSEYILKVIETTKRSPEATFLFITRNVKRFQEFLDFFPSNVVLGSSIESNRNYPQLSKAPSATERLFWMSELRKISDRKLMVAVEPVLKFDESSFLDAIKRVAPSLVVVGYDNYRNNLPEPALAETLHFIESLRSFTTVVTKTLREST